MAKTIRSMHLKQYYLIDLLFPRVQFKLAVEVRAGDTKLGTEAASKSKALYITTFLLLLLFLFPLTWYSAFPLQDLMLGLHTPSAPQELPSSSFSKKN